MASPENDIPWAEGAIASDLSFPATEQVSGYKVGEDYPNAQINQYRRDVARWVSRGFDDLALLNDVLPAGAIAPLNDDANTVAPLGVIEDVDALNNVAHVLAADGKYLWSLELDLASPYNKLRRYDRSDLAAGPQLDIAIQTANFTLNARAIACNGTHVAIVTEANVELYTVAGAFIWTMNHGGLVYDICLDHEAVYFVGEPGTGAFHARKVLFSAGTGSIPTSSSAWDYNHGAVLQACTTDGVHLYIGGVASGGTSIRALSASAGTVVWNSLTALTVQKRCLKTDGRDLFSASVSGVDTVIERRGVAVATTFGAVPILQTLTITSAAAATGLHLDNEFFVLGLDSNLILWTRGFSPVAIQTPGPRACTTDGDQIYESNTGGSNDLRTLARPNRPSIWRRIDPSTAQFAPYRWLSIPESR